MLEIVLANAFGFVLNFKFSCFASSRSDRGGFYFAAKYSCMRAALSVHCFSRS